MWPIRVEGAISWKGHTSCQESGKLRGMYRAVCRTSTVGPKPARVMSLSFIVAISPNTFPNASYLHIVAAICQAGWALWMSGRTCFCEEALAGFSVADHWRLSLHFTSVAPDAIALRRTCSEMRTSGGKL